MKFMLLNWLLALLPMTRWFALKRRLLRLFGVEIGEGSRVCGHVQFYGAGRVNIGARCWIGINTCFYTSEGGGDVTIGDQCDVAPDVCFHTGSHGDGDHGRRAGADRAGPITVGAGSWIGVRATLLADTVIAPGTLIGAGALVTRGDYPTDALLLGVPARIMATLPA